MQQNPAGWHGVPLGNQCLGHHLRSERALLHCAVAVQVSQNYIDRVTHIIAQSADEDTFKARQRKRDMIRCASTLLSD